MQTSKKITLYRTAYDTIGKEVDLDEVLEMIGLGEWEEQVVQLRGSNVSHEIDSIKKRLPAASFSGAFSERLDNKCYSYTGIYQVDIDKIKSSDYKRLFNLMCQDPHVYSAFKSPSGNGMKILFVVDTNVEEVNSDDIVKYHKDKYVAIREYFNKAYGITIDRSCSNISRLCFVSFDPVIHYNPMAEPFVASYYFDMSKINRKMEHVVSKNNNGGEIETNMKVIFLTAKKWVEDSGIRYVKGSRHHYLLNMCCIMNRAGMKERDIRNMINSNHSLNREMDKDLNRILQSIKEEYSNEYFTKPIWKKRKQPSLGLDLTDLM